VLFVAGAVLSGLLFTALTLTIGGRSTSASGARWSAASAVPSRPARRASWSTVGEGCASSCSASIALLTLALGFVPVVGGVLATVVGVLLSGRLLARGSPRAPSTPAA
jgi:CysZ protein